MEVAPVGLENGLPETGVRAPLAGFTTKAEMVLVARFDAKRKAGVRRVTVTVVVPVTEPLAPEIVAVPGPRVFPMPTRPAELFKSITVESLDDHLTVCVRSCELPSVSLPVAVNC